ncbi:MAG TPA: hypothetical protein PL044_01430 [Clostridiales bacterium]|nr:MAG: hypothetical protein BWY37_00089 [Firmicutes bacterium ADurb.Bin262]HOU09999.1 hypothetical protein [Clostridiales bacterium]HQK72431.1 hypothetical protein [Clostridiales bacterium]
MDFSAKDRDIIRRLASRYMEYACLSVQREKMEWWKALNRGKPVRPMIAIDQLPLNELNAQGELDCLCEDGFCRMLEAPLRLAVYKWEHFPADMVLEPFITVPKNIRCSGYSIGADETTLATDEANGVVSHKYKNLIKTFDDISKIKDVHYEHDEETSRLWLDGAAALLDGIAPVRQSGGVQFHLGVWDTLSTLMGVDQIYYDILDRPDFIHAVMERITSALLNGIEEADRLGLCDDTANTCHCSYCYTDELLPDFGAGKGPRAQNAWAFGMAQLFTSVSPAVTAEFEIPYISRMAERFGMLYYGCCDRLDDRLDLVKQIPHLKKVSCSPWSDREKFAEAIGPGLVMSVKPNPALLAMDTFDPVAVKKDLDAALDAAKRNNVCIEFILKDISTVRYEPQRLTRWAEIALRAAES